MFKKLETPLVVFLSLFLLILCMIPIIYRYHITPKDREYLGYHEFYTDDYSIYISNIYQGQYGRWTLLDKHTSEPHEGTIIHDEYLLWGKLTNIFKIGPIISYHLFRFTMGFILLMVIYKFLKIIYPAGPDGHRDNSGARILAFIFILFSFGFPIITQTAAGTQISQHMEWLTELDVFARFVALPHYLLGNIFFLLNVIVFFKISSSGKLSIVKFANECSDFKKITSCQLLIIFSILAALVHPVSVVSLIFIYGVYIFISIFLNFFQNFGAANVFFRPQRVPPDAIGEGCEHCKKMFANQNLKNSLLTFLITIISAAPILLFYKYLMTIPPWNHMAAWEGVSKYNIPFQEYIGAIGPNFFLAPIGFLIMFYKSFKPKLSIVNCQLSIFLFSWILSFFLLVFFSYPFLHISEVRLMQVFIFIPFAILSAYAIINFGSFFGAANVFFQRAAGPRLRERALKKMFANQKIFIIFLIIILFLIYLPLYTHSFKSKLFYYPTNSMLAFPPKEWMKAIYYLQGNTPKNSVVLAEYMGGTIIPFTAGNTVYTGHYWATLDRVRKEALRDKFFTNKMTEKEAYEFLSKEKINYIFDGYQEAAYGFNPKNYPFLKPVFSSQMAVIFKFLP